jgi:predicted enzyme related to lactoylglutathione lyase
MKMNPVVHFEMPTQNPKRVAKFYTEVFGWQNTVSGPEMGNYVLATTTESDENGPKNPGAINGGFYTKTTDMPEPYPLVVIRVDDINEHMKKITSAGGTVIDKPVDIPGVGWYVAFHDTEGNRVCLLEPHT